MDLIDLAIMQSLNGGGGSGESPVSSVNGMTGEVTLDASNVGAIPSDTAEYRKSSAQDLIDAGKAEKTDLNKTDRSLDALWKLNKGQTWDFDVDTDTTYVKTVPSGAHWCSVDTIGGRSVVANQLIMDPKFTDLNSWYTGGGTGSISNNELTVVKSGSAHLSIRPSVFAGLKQDRKYIILFKIKRNTTSNVTLHAFSESQEIYTIHCEADVWADVKTIYQSNINSELLSIYQGLNRGWEDGSQISVKEYMAVDLTQWFGSGNEPATTDDPRMAEVYAYLDEHPEYNAGSIVSAEVTAVEVADSDSVVTETVSIPAAIKALDGYGQSHETDVNTVDYANAIYRKKGYYDSNGDWGTDVEDIDISDLLPDDFLCSMPVEAGGTITFKQTGDTEIAVPVTNEFIVKLSEVN